VHAAYATYRREQPVCREAILGLRSASMMAATLAEAQTLSVERAEPFVTDVDTERHALTTVDEPWTVVARALSREPGLSDGGSTMAPP